MIGDIGVVMWKEWREILSGGGGRSKISLLIVVGILGIFIPLQMGNVWVESPIMLLYWSWVPLLLLAPVVADSFAGERERCTLETLLASRLSDRAILLGKVGAAVGYGVGITWLTLLIGLAIINFTQSQGELLLYPATMGLGIVGLSLMSAGLAASAGCLVSLRAASVRQAQQTLVMAIMVLFFGSVFGIQAFPEAWRARISESLTGMDTARLIVTAVMILAVINAGLLIAASARFKRTRLILD